MMAFLAGTEPKNTCGPSRGGGKPDTPAEQDAQLRPPSPAKAKGESP